MQREETRSFSLGALVPLPSSTRAIAHDSPKVHMNACRVNAVHRLARECISRVRQYTAERLDRLCENQSVHIHTFDAYVGIVLSVVYRVSKNRGAIKKKKKKIWSSQRKLISTCLFLYQIVGARV